MTVTWVYTTWWWDGPLSGKVQTEDGRQLWAHMINEPEGNQPRVFGLYEMPAAWWTTEAIRHELWTAAMAREDRAAALTEYRKVYSESEDPTLVGTEVGRVTEDDIQEVADTTVSD